MANHSLMLMELAKASVSDARYFAMTSRRLSANWLQISCRDGGFPHVLQQDVILVSGGNTKRTDGRIRLDLTSTDRPIPRVGTGDVLELTAGGEVHLSGTYHPD